MLACSILGSEQVIRCQPSNRFSNNLCLPRQQIVILRVAHEEWDFDIVNRIAQLKVYALGSPLECRLGIECPQALLNGPAERRRRLGAGHRKRYGLVNGFFVARVVESEQLRGELLENRGAKVADAVDGHDCGDARLKSCGASGEISSQRVSPKTDGVVVDIVSRQGVVDDRGYDSLPVMDEAQVLLSADSGLAGPLIRDDIDAPRESSLDSHVIELFLGTIIAAAHEDGWATAGTSAAVEDGRHVKPVGLERDSLARDWEKRNGLVKGRPVLLPGRVDARVLPVAMEEELGRTKIRGFSEQRRPRRDGILAHVDPLGLLVYTDSKVVEGSVVALKVSRGDFSSGREDLANIGALVGCDGDDAEDFEVEALVGA